MGHVSTDLDVHMWLKRQPHRMRLFLTRVKIAAHQKHLPLFSMKLATQEASVLTHGSGTSLQTFLTRVKIAACQKINAPVWAPLHRPSPSGYAWPWPGARLGNWVWPTELGSRGPWQGGVGMAWQGGVGMAWQAGVGMAWQGGVGMAWQGGVGGYGMAGWSGWVWHGKVEWVGMAWQGGVGGYGTAGWGTHLDVARLVDIGRSLRDAHGDLTMQLGAVQRPRHRKRKRLTTRLPHRHVQTGSEGLHRQEGSGLLGMKVRQWLCTQIFSKIICVIRG